MANSPLQAANSNDLRTPTILDMDGNPFVSAVSTNQQSNSLGSGSGGGTGDHAVSIGKLETRVDHAFLWLTILSGAAGAVFLFVLTLLWTMHSDIAGINTNFAVQTVQTNKISGIEQSLDRIEGRLEGGYQPEAGAAARQAGAVRGGKRGRKPTG